MSAALRVDGPLFRLPGGDVRLAIGAEYRRERFDYFTLVDISSLTPTLDPNAIIPGKRNVRAAYAELYAPIFGEDNEIRSEERRVGKECVSTCSSRSPPKH